MDRISLSLNPFVSFGADEEQQALPDLENGAQQPSRSARISEEQELMGIEKSFEDTISPTPAPFFSLSNSVSLRPISLSPISSSPSSSSPSSSSSSSSSSNSWSSSSSRSGPSSSSSSTLASDSIRLRAHAPYSQLSIRSASPERTDSADDVAEKVVEPKPVPKPEPRPEPVSQRAYDARALRQALATKIPPKSERGGPETFQKFRAIVNELFALSKTEFSIKLFRNDVPKEEKKKFEKVASQLVQLHEKLKMSDYIKEPILLDSEAHFLPIAVPIAAKAAAKKAAKGVKFRTLDSEEHLLPIAAAAVSKLEL